MKSYAKPALRLQTTTLWEYPSQHYGATVQGDSRYIGATPSHVIWNILQRYTRPNDLIVDPMCGSGTTLDVAQDLGRRAEGFDISPSRADICVADARALPCADASVDLLFVDPPYGDHIHYSDDPACIGKLSALEDDYLAALDDVFREAHRILRPTRYIAVYICDFFAKKRGFAPLGAAAMWMLGQYFRPVDHICVVRHNKALKKANFHQAAEEENFFLRGFNHLLIAKKVRQDTA
jgi:adenine-specific DNA-methyltransferase